MTVEIIDPGFLTTIQDLGRTGYERYGVPVSGAIDRFALMAANGLVCNPESAACLEFAVQGPTLYTWDECMVALCGGGFSLEVDGQIFPPWMSVRARKGATIRAVAGGSGTWGTLAFSGGIVTMPVMGSQSTYLRGGFGGVDGRVLAVGDVLIVPQVPPDVIQSAGRDLPVQYRPDYQANPTLRVILGPQADAFSDAGTAIFLNSEYILTQTADRMGYRFEGPIIEHSAPADILSDGIVFGAIQVPANGQPIVLMSDCQTTGGYTKIATVISADLPVLAQCLPGISRVQYHAIEVKEAQEIYRRLIAGLKTGLSEREDDLWASV